MEDLPECEGEERVSIVDQEPQPGDAVTQVHGQVAGLLSRPCSGRVCGYSGQVQSRGAVLDEDQHIQPLEQDITSSDPLITIHHLGHIGTSVKVSAPVGPPEALPLTIELLQRGQVQTDPAQDASPLSGRLGCAAMMTGTALRHTRIGDPVLS
ncbi:hypothetical protein GCM10022419_114160 [Nonomuraea rosea]|uniref:Uncharacterized protein n=1 Tax=Nonomuraea rosea TaxID=638574 RepID=A0ABP6ZLV9_9ACTN